MSRWDPRLRRRFRRRIPAEQKAKSKIRIQNPESEGREQNFLSRTDDALTTRARILDFGFWILDFASARPVLQRAVQEHECRTSLVAPPRAIHEPRVDPVVRTSDYTLHTPLG